MTNLERIKAHCKSELAAGRQITFTAAFAISRPALHQIRHWFYVPENLRKAEAVEWLAGKAIEEFDLPRGVQSWCRE